MRIRKKSHALHGYYDGAELLRYSCLDFRDMLQMSEDKFGGMLLKNVMFAGITTAKYMSCWERRCADLYRATLI